MTDELQERVGRIQGDRVYRIFVNDERTVLVRLWTTGLVEVATREEKDDLWGPPTFLKEEEQ
jgi:hypothetical protein